MLINHLIRGIINGDQNVFGHNPLAINQSIIAKYKINGIET